MFQNFKCPSCGKEMRQGYLLGGIKHYLYWFPKGKKPSALNQLVQGWPLWRPGSVEDGMLLNPPVADGVVKMPTLICPECKVALLDFDEEHALEE